MLRSAFRHKSSKDPKDLSNDGPVSFSDLEDKEVESFKDAVEDTNESLEEEEESQGDLNKNLLTKIGNPSLDYQLDKEDENNFPYTEREIYEMQLVQLQEQLVAIMIQDQEKGEKLKKYVGLDIDKLSRDLKAEQDKNTELAEKIKVFKNKAQNQKITRANASRSDPRRKGNHNSKCLDMESSSTEDWVDLSADMNDSDKPEQNAPLHASTSLPDGNQSPKPEKHQLTEAVLPRLRSDDQPDGAEQSINKHPRIQNYKKKIIELIVDRLWDFVNEEPESSSEDIDDDNGDALAVKTLKENINRFTNAIKPITSFIKSAAKIGGWSNPAASLMAFIVYMYAARHGYLFSFLLLLIIWRLFLNYLYARGIAARIGLANKEKDEPPSEDKSWSDKFQLVLQVARKVQNILGKMADYMEKIKNLLTWHHPATRTLFTYLCILFTATIVLNGPTLFMFMALGFGIKVFITGPLYARFPKVKQRYDGVARILKELPTDADLAAKEIVDSENAGNPSINHKATDTLMSSPSSDQHTYIHGGSQYWASFCDRLKIPLTEIPLPTWEEGRRCTLMNKDKPLTNMKHGRLFLTQNFLCFERTKTGSSKNCAIKLTNISHVSKCKPIGIMPGTGMAIEVEVKGLDKPYIFGALLGRDECFDSLIMTGRTAELEWAK